jgi:hypothetical protein
MKTFEGMDGFEKSAWLLFYAFYERVDFSSADHSGRAV